MNNHLNEYEIIDALEDIISFVLSEIKSEENITEMNITEVLAENINIEEITPGYGDGVLVQVNGKRFNIAVLPAGE